MAIETTTELHEKAAQLASDSLRELWGAEKFQRLVDDPKATVSLLIDIKDHVVSVCVKWPGELGDKLQLPVQFRFGKRQA